MSSEHMHLSVDLDSTLCDTRHRKGIIEQFTKNGLPIDWDVYARACADDEPTALVKILHVWQTTQCWHVVSGRSEGAREATEEWLSKHGLCPTSINLENGQTAAHSALGHTEWKARRVLEVAQAWPRIGVHIDDWAPVGPRIEELSEGRIKGMTVSPPGTTSVVIGFPQDNPGEVAETAL